MTEWHRAFSLSIAIPIPIPIATPTPIALWMTGSLVIHSDVLLRAQHFQPLLKCPPLPEVCPDNLLL
jgi:hypothetical protein